MNPQDTVYIPVPVSEKPENTTMRYAVIGKLGNTGALATAAYTVGIGWKKDGSDKPFPDYFTHWLKPVKLSEITTSQPVKSNEDILVKAVERLISAVEDKPNVYGYPNEIKAVREALSSYRTSVKGEEQENGGYTQEELQELEKEVKRLKGLIKEQWEDKYPHPEAVQDLWQQFCKDNNIQPIK